MTSAQLFPIFVPQGRSKTRFKVGYIDQKGQIVLEPKFDEGTRFYDGLATVGVRNRRGVINASGEFVIQPAPWGWGQFHDGLANVSVKGIWGIVDANGNFVLKPKYDYLERFREGRAVFRIGKFQERHSWRYGFLDKTGAEVVPAAFHNAYGFSEGLAAVKVGNLWGYIDPSGVFKIMPRFEGSRQGARRIEDTRAGYFMDGLAPVWSGEGYGFIDNTGKLVIEGCFDEADSFRDNRALVQHHNRFGFIDLAGRNVIKARFTYASHFSEGLAMVREKDYGSGFIPPCGFIDIEGNVVIEPAFCRAEIFRNNLSLVTTEDSIGYINRIGEFVWKGSRVDYGIVS